MARHFEYKDIVEFNARKRGHTVAVVVKAHRISRGRNAGTVKYKVAPIGQTGMYYEVPGAMLQASAKEVTEAEIQAALGEQADIAHQRVENKAKRDETNRDGLEAADINVGDRVLIRHKRGNWEADVARINHANGRISIYSAGTKSGERWLDARHVIKVIQVERSVPVKLSERIMDDLQAQGWAQVQYGREFIERSYVVAFTKALARKGQSYECASDQVHYDPDTKLFWRETGSFD